ncbi:hypothetical protein B0H12DRAFT_1124090 [Mycena haematopus]|nr:hypothetical protein B0H12DRAFT_1124090 [Mycena haematopus]
MYPDGRANPTPTHFAKNKSTELHPPISPRLLQQRRLDREGRAICRVVYSHGIALEKIAKVFCVSEDTVIDALKNKPTNPDHDNAENDYWYVSAEYRHQYPPLSEHEDHGTLMLSKKGVDGSEAEKANPNEPSEIILTKKVQSSDCDGGADHSSSSEAPAWLQNPSARHFKDNLPVTVNGFESISRLDRKGRAICRIMHPYIENYSKIAAIFGITHSRVRRAVLNAFSPSDNVAEDYDFAGKDFKKEYPPLSANKQSADKRPRSPELDDVPQKRAKRGQITHPEPGACKIPALPVRTVIKVPREIPVVEVPVRPKADPRAAGIKDFLKNVGGFDLSHWQQTFKDKGLRTMGDLRTLAGLEEPRLVKTLTKLLASDSNKMAEVHILLLADALLDLAHDVA